MTMLSPQHLNNSDLLIVGIEGVIDSATDPATPEWRGWGNAGTGTVDKGQGDLMAAAVGKVPGSTARAAAAAFPLAAPLAKFDRSHLNLREPGDARMADGKTERLLTHYGFAVRLIACPPLADGSLESTGPTPDEVKAFIDTVFNRAHVEVYADDKSHFLDPPFLRQLTQTVDAGPVIGPMRELPAPIRVGEGLKMPFECDLSRPATVPFDVAKLGGLIVLFNAIFKTRAAAD